jgi:hypothetical protein
MSSCDWEPLSKKTCNGSQCGIENEELRLSNSCPTGQYKPNMCPPFDMKDFSHIPLEWNKCYLTTIGQKFEEQTCTPNSNPPCKYDNADGSDASCFGKASTSTTPATNDQIVLEKCLASSPGTVYNNYPLQTVQCTQSGTSGFCRGKIPCILHGVWGGKIKSIGCSTNKYTYGKDNFDLMIKVWQDYITNHSGNIKEFSNMNDVKQSYKVATTKTNSANIKDVAFIKVKNPNPKPNDDKYVIAGLSVGHGVLDGKCGSLSLIKYNSDNVPGNDRYLLNLQSGPRAWSLELWQTALTYLMNGETQKVAGGQCLVPEVINIDWDDICSLNKELACPSNLSKLTSKPISCPTPNYSGCAQCGTCINTIGHAANLSQSQCNLGGASCQQKYAFPYYYYDKFLTRALNQNNVEPSKLKETAYSEAIKIANSVSKPVSQSTADSIRNQSTLSSSDVATLWYYAFPKGIPGIDVKSIPIVNQCASTLIIAFGEAQNTGSDNKIKKEYILGYNEVDPLKEIQSPYVLSLFNLCSANKGPIPQGWISQNNENNIGQFCHYIEQNSGVGWGGGMCSGGTPSNAPDKYYPPVCNVKLNSCGFGLNKNTSTYASLHANTNIQVIQTTSNLMQKMNMPDKKVGGWLMARDPTPLLEKGANWVSVGAFQPTFVNPPQRSSSRFSNPSQCDASKECDLFITLGGQGVQTDSDFWNNFTKDSNKVRTSFIDSLFKKTDEGGFGLGTEYFGVDFDLESGLFKWGICGCYPDNTSCNYKDNYSQLYSSLANNDIYYPVVDLNNVLNWNQNKDPNFLFGNLIKLIKDIRATYDNLFPSSTKKKLKFQLTVLGNIHNLYAKDSVNKYQVVNGINRMMKDNYLDTICLMLYGADMGTCSINSQIDLNAPYSDWGVNQMYCSNVEAVVSDFKNPTISTKSTNTGSVQINTKLNNTLGYLWDWYNLLPTFTSRIYLGMSVIGVQMPQIDLYSSLCKSVANGGLDFAGILYWCGSTNDGLCNNSKSKKSSFNVKQCGQVYRDQLNKTTNTSCFIGGNTNRFSPDPSTMDACNNLSGGGNFCSSMNIEKYNTWKGCSVGSPSGKCCLKPCQEYYTNSNACLTYNSEDSCNSPKCSWIPSSMNNPSSYKSYVANSPTCNPCPDGKINQQMAKSLPASTNCKSGEYCVSTDYSGKYKCTPLQSFPDPNKCYSYNKDKCGKQGPTATATSCSSPNPTMCCYKAPTAKANRVFCNTTDKNKCEAYYAYCQWNGSSPGKPSPPGSKPSKPSAPYNGMLCSEVPVPSQLSQGVCCVLDDKIAWQADCVKSTDASSCGGYHPYCKWFPKSDTKL